MNLKKSVFLLLIPAVLVMLFIGQQTARSQQKPLPNVLIIGDSISMGYTPYVAEMLKEEATVQHNEGNAEHTDTGLKRLDQWLGTTKWDVIYFNWGLWDLCYRSPTSKVQGNRDKVNGTVTTSLEQYEQNLDQLVLRLKKTGATLIWAQTTVVPEGEAGRIVGDDKKYNEAAARVMKKHGILIDDLHALTSHFPTNLFEAPGNVHYTKDGYRKIAVQVTDKIRTALKPNSPRSGPPTLIFLLAGQSNMVGLGEVSLLPQVFRLLPTNVAIWEGGGWRPMNVQGATFGPEVAFARAVASALPNERIGIVKYAKNGTAIKEWAPNDQQSLYAELMKQYRAALRAAPGARPAAMLWMQGERDSRQADTAAAYGRNLQELVAAARKDVGQDTLAFLCGLVNPPIQTYTYVDTVRAAQTALPKQLRRVALVSTSELQKKADDLHYDAKGQIELGLRFAQAYLHIERASETNAGKDTIPLSTADLFACGAIWSGKRAFDSAKGLEPEDMWLIVTERDGMKFKGEVFFLRGAGKDDICKVEGTATSMYDGPVSFTTEKKGFFQLNFQGKLIQRELVLSFSGSGYIDGTHVSGTTNLKP